MLIDIIRIELEMRLYRNQTKRLIIGRGLDFLHISILVMLIDIITCN